MKAKKKQKQVSIEEYIETYCKEKRIRERNAVYVNPETHRKLKEVAEMFANKYYTTVSSLADSIITRHFEEHKELLNETYEENSREFLAWLKAEKTDGNEAPDAYQREEDKTKIHSVDDPSD
jgi:2-keto-3-deoxy-galactonokinase